MADDLPDIQANILSHIPNSVLEKHFRNDSVVEALPSVSHSRAIVLSTNILHFSHITQHYLKDNPNGLDMVASIHKQFVDLIQEHIKDIGADMFRYSTDRMLFYWEIPSVETERWLSILPNIIMYQILQIKQILTNKFSNQDILINFSFILTEGTLTTFSVGENQLVTDHIYGGPSLFEAFECPRPEADEIIVLASHSIMQRIQNDFQVSSIDYIQEDGKPEPSNFFLIRRPHDNCEAANSYIEGFDLRKAIRPDQVQGLRDEIRLFVPKCLESYIMNGIEIWGSEIRKVSVGFLSVPLDIQNLNYQEELIKLQETMRIVRLHVQSYGGTVYRTYLDSRGINIFMVFGLYPECHVDDSVRCILTAHAISTDLTKMELPVFIGISTGEVLLSICGTYQRDLFLIGEPLYTAYILSLVSLKEGSKRIIVDFESKVTAEVKISFHLYKDPVFTGKIAEGIYEVIYTGKPLPANPLNSFPEIRTHHFNVDFSSSNTLEDKLTSLFMVGRETELQSAKQIFLQFLRNPVKPNVLLVVGPCGIGKSLFAKNLLEIINETADKMNSFGNRPVVLVSSVNPSSRVGKLNGWKFIMREILQRIALSYGQQKEDLLYGLLEMEPDLQSHIPLLKDILDLEIVTEQEEKILYTEENHAEVPEYEQKIINKILLVILQRFLGEKVTFGSPGSNQTPKLARDTSKEGCSSLVICLDDIQEHDDMSWNLLSKISKRLQKVFIIGLLRDDEISTKCIKNVEQGMQSLSANQNVVLNKITLDPLKMADIGSLIKRILGDREPSEDLKKFIASKCEGNPLIVINLLESLLKQGMMQEVTGVVFPTENLQRLIRLGELVEIKVPAIKQKLNGVTLDKLNFTQYNVLKIASIIGDSFDMKTLVTSNPFHTTLLNYNNLAASLQELRRIGLLDLADNRSKNTVYKFAVPFLRETMYQRIAPFLRRRQHRLVALSNEDQTEVQGKKEDKVLYHWQLSELGQENRRNRNDMTKRAFLLKQINSIISQPIKRGDTIIKVGELEKKSYKTPNKWSSRFVALTQNTLKYYHNEREFNEKPVFQTGLIPLKHITAINLVISEGLNTKAEAMQKPGVRLFTAKWEKGTQEIGSREFYFGCSTNDEAEDWRICIEHMRNKAVYEDFLQVSESLKVTKTVSAKSNSSPGTKGDGKQNIKIWMHSSNQEDLEFRDFTTPDGSPSTRRVKLLEGNSKNASPSRIEGREGFDIAKRQKNKEILKTFFNKGQIVFWSYLFNAPFKGSIKGKGFGKNPDLLLSKPDLMRIDPSLVRSEPNLDVSMSRRDVSPRLPSGLDRAITEKLSSYDRARIDVKPNMLQKTGFSALPAGFWAQKTQSGFADDTLDDSVRTEHIFGNNVLEDLSYSKRSITPERKKGSMLLPSASYRDDNCSVTVEEITKNQQILKGRQKQQMLDTSITSRRDKSPSTMVSFGIKGRKNLSRPNIYGRYEFIPTFFVDSYMDDKILISKSNQVMRVGQKKRMIMKANIPNNAIMVLNRMYDEEGEEVYVMNEESHERMKNQHQRKTLLSSRLEDEAPIYKSPTRLAHDFTKEEYSLKNSINFANEKVDQILERISLRKVEMNPRESKLDTSYSTTRSIYPGRDSVSSIKSPVSHIKHKSDLIGGNLYPVDNDKSYDFKESSRLTPVRTRMNDVSGFVVNRPGNVEEERRSLATGMSTMSQNHSLISDNSPLRPSNNVSVLGRKDPVDMYSRPTNLYSEAPNKLETSYRESNRTPRGFTKEDELNDSRSSDIRKYNPNNSTTFGDSPLDKFRQPQREHNMKSYPTQEQDPAVRMSSYISNDKGISPLKDFAPINKGLLKTLNAPYNDPVTTRYSRPEEPQFRAPAPNTFGVLPKEVSNPQSQPIFKAPFPIQTPNYGPNSSTVNSKFSSNQSAVSFASPLLDPRHQKISPASNERANTSITVNPPKSLINPSEYFCMAYTKRDTTSQDGDIFTLGKREFVVVTRLYEKRGLAELLWNGLSGLFPLSDIELVHQDDPREINRQVALGTYEEVAKSNMNRSPNYFVGYNQPGREEVKNTRNASPMYRDSAKVDASAPRFGASVDYCGQSPSTPLTPTKMPSKMMMRQMKKMQESRGSQGLDDSSFVKNQ